MYSFKTMRRANRAIYANANGALARGGGFETDPRDGPISGEQESMSGRPCHVCGGLSRYRISARQWVCAPSSRRPYGMVQRKNQSRL
jgi:hypothetical protein